MSGDFRIVFLLVLTLTFKSYVDGNALVREIYDHHGVSASRLRMVHSGSGFGVRDQTLVDSLTPMLTESNRQLLLAISREVWGQIEAWKSTCRYEMRLTPDAVMTWETQVLSPDRIDRERTYVVITFDDYERGGHCIFNLRGELVDSDDLGSLGAVVHAAGASQHSGFIYDCRSESDCIKLTRLDAPSNLCEYRYRNMSLYFRESDTALRATYFGDEKLQLKHGEGNDCMHIMNGFYDWLSRSNVIDSSFDMIRDGGTKIINLKMRFGYRSFTAEYNQALNEVRIGRESGTSFCLCSDIVLHELFHAFYVVKIATVITWEGRLLTEAFSDIAGMTVARSLYPHRYAALPVNEQWFLARNCTKASSIRARDIQHPSSSYFTRYDQFIERIFSNFSSPFKAYSVVYRGSTIFSHAFYKIQSQVADKEEVLHTWLTAGIAHFHPFITLPEAACRIMQMTETARKSFTQGTRRAFEEAGFDVSSSFCGSFPPPDCSRATRSKNGIQEVRFEGDWRAFVKCRNGKEFKSECVAPAKVWNPPIEQKSCAEMPNGQDQNNNCLNPTKIENGHYILYTSSKTVGYACDDGFELIGEQYLTCNNRGEWSNTAPECVPIGGGGVATTKAPCVYPNTPTDGFVKPWHEHENWFIFGCNDGFELAGLSHYDCTFRYHESQGYPPKCSSRRATSINSRTKAKNPLLTNLFLILFIFYSFNLIHF